MKPNQKSAALGSIQKKLFRTQLILVLTLALFLGGAGIVISIHFETMKRDQNLQNVATAVARSPMLTEGAVSSALTEYLDGMQSMLDSIDVISVVSADGTRLYHTNHALIGTRYDGAFPTFTEAMAGYYAVNDNGPSGRQRRAYAAITGEEGEHLGIVMAITLMRSVQEETAQVLLVYGLITLAAILVELMISARLSLDIRRSLMGYEPDAFTAMYRMRDNILESLDEGIVAADPKGQVQFYNRAAAQMLGDGVASFNPDEPQTGRDSILIDRVPIREGNTEVGTVAILHDRAEYTRLMEDLAGTRYLVDSMRASNHDFTNKLHVILGLIQMEMYDKAISYIQNITIVQRETVSGIMRAVDEPAVAALLIGKMARAAELNVKFVLREGSRYQKADLPLPTEMLVTVIGNLVDNAFDAMNDGALDTPKELLFGIYSRPGAVLITTDDTGTGISEENQARIFDKGFSTKGEGRGTGLHQVKTMVERLGGVITVESQEGVGTSFSVSFMKKEGA